MADTLQHYRAKRNFKLTSEPAGGGSANAKALSFVVQKHWASHLHYDFRLELGGAMKSWAVPKGPSYDTADKRMAVQVEDHPIAYNRFEGEIPSGQYGAGKVVIWDKGIWLPLGDPAKGWREGKLKFELRGHKLRGHWTLVRMHGKAEQKQPPWLLIKEKDGLQRPAAEFSVIDEMPDSVKALPDVAPADATPVDNGDAVKVEGGGKAAAPAADREAPTGGPALPAKAKKAALPDELQPELATLVDAPPGDAQDWVYEIKFDGYRLLTRVDGGEIRLITRNGHDWTHKLRALHAALAAMKLPRGWYDGEIVVLNGRGVPDFGALQRAFDEARPADIVYYLFDVPYLGAYDLREVPLIERRAVLQAVLQAAHAPAKQVRFSEVFAATPADMVASACKLGLEGVIGKRRESVYASRRSNDWIKLKCSQRQEFVIGGYTDPQGSRAGLGSLLLGVHDEKGALRYAGNVGTGFDQNTLRDLQKKLEALATDSSPFAEGSEIPKKPHWVQPHLLAEVSFGEWTHSGRIRHSVFHGLRGDKKPAAIVREQPVHAAALAKKSPSRAATAVVPGRARANAKVNAAPAATLPASVHVTHPERVIDAQSGVTKIDLVRYYALVAPLMLEHLKGRPVALVRAPDGVGSELFFQKHAKKLRLEGVRQLDPALDPGHDALLEVVSAAGLTSAAQFNVIELHTWNALKDQIERPDRMTFDLDPGDGVPWAQMQEAAQLVKVLLDELGLPAFLKTSGGKGLHVVVPLKRLHDWDTVKGFSQAAVQHLASTIPQRFVAKSGPKNRVGKIFVDYLRNGRGATTVSAWSARARPGLGVSVPLAWDELQGLKSSDQWAVHSIHQRLDRGNAPWDGYAKAATGLAAAMKKLGYRPPS